MFTVGPAVWEPRTTDGGSVVGSVVRNVGAEVGVDLMMPVKGANRIVALSRGTANSGHVDSARKSRQPSRLEVLLLSISNLLDVPMSALRIGDSSAIIVAVSSVSNRPVVHCD